MRYVGIDISKNRLDTCIVDETGKIVTREALPNDEEGFDELAELVDPAWPIGIEAGTLAYPVHDHLTVRGYDIRMGDAKRMKIIWECDQKFDGKDAFEIADLVRVNKFPDVYVPDPEVLEARELVRARKDVVEQSTKAKQRLGAYLRREGIRPPFGSETLYSRKGLDWLRDQDVSPGRGALMEAFISQIEALAPRVEALDRMVARLIVDDEIVDRLVSVPGVGLHNAAVIRFEVGTMDRFETIGAFRAFAGSVPRNKQSGGPARQQGVVRRCSKRLKGAVGIAAESAAVKTKGENPVKRMYEKQLGRGKPRSTALGHARAKLCNTLYAIWAKGEECWWQNPDSTHRKRIKIKRLARQGPAS